MFGMPSRPVPSSEQKLAAAEDEIDAIGHMYRQLLDTCTRKCIPPAPRESDLNKGESVCLDRCVAKFFEVNVKVSEKMQAEMMAKNAIAN